MVDLFQEQLQYHVFLPPWHQISLFDADARRTNCEFSGVVTSTMKPLESQCSGKDGGGVFVSTFHQARNHTDQWANLNFIVHMKKMGDGGDGDKNNNAGVGGAASTNPVPGTSSGAASAAASATAAAPASTSAAAAPEPMVS